VTFSLLFGVQTSSWAHPALCPMGAGRNVTEAWIWPFTSTYSEG